ncbi:MAG: hypothetical protein QOH78_91, partial [Verrucomicrobiota bacterium]
RQGATPEESALKKSVFKLYHYRRLDVAAKYMFF